jgi:hypothetical protein
MSIGLIYRMRTCAAALRDHCDNVPPQLYRDACELLEEASNVLDSTDDVVLGEPMEIIEPVSPPRAVGANWTGMDLPAPTPRSCPNCGSEVPKTVRRHQANGRLGLQCPACLARWDWRP